MPHVVLAGDATSVDLCQALVPIVENRDAWRVKIDEIYVERRGGRALASVVVVEEDHPQTFYIVVAKNDARGQLTVRLDPSTDPIKTCGVKRSIAVVAERLLKYEESLSVVRHNIQGYLELD